MSTSSRMGQSTATKLDTVISKLEKAASGSSHTILHLEVRLVLEHLGLLFVRRVCDVGRRAPPEAANTREDPLAGPI